MCGRYFIDSDADGPLRQIVDALNRRGVAAKTGGEIFPTDAVPVVARSRAGAEKPFAMRWGFSLGGSRTLINARSETAAELPAFSDAMRRRRCLVPASGYYEWLRRSGRADRYAVRLSGEEPLFMAGLYRYEGDRPAFVILTRESAEAVRPMHERMPVILPPEAARAWLSPETDAWEALRAAREDVLPRAEPGRADEAEPEQLSLFDEA